ncbi:MAG TPA: TonB-dependent siderophore receptor [Rhodanobacteraceae bacterium]|nr:TonB-dependent siderophore receptor [Rhodanobacteraceae bacterium]
MASGTSIVSIPHPPRRLLATALVAFAPFAGHAAEDPAPATPDDAAADRRKNMAELDTVSVEGSDGAEPMSPKFTAPLLDTPRSVTVVPQQVIQDTGSTTLVDALRTVPGITFGAGEGGNPVGDRPFIRGYDAGADIYVDGIRDVGSQTREAFDIEQIDVTKGPSSAYTGRGAIGGSINIVTKAPKADDFVAGSVGLGTDQYQRATLDANKALSDDVAFRVNLMEHSADVPGRDGPDVSRWGIAPSVTFGMNSPTRATLSYYHLSTDDTPDSGIPYNNPFAATNPNAPLNGDGSPVDVDRENFYGLLGRDFRKTKADIGTALIAHDFGNGWTLRNTTRYGRTANDYIWTNPDDSVGNFLTNGYVYRSPKSRVTSTKTAANQTDLTGEFETGSVRHTIATGIEFDHERTEVDQYIVTNPDGITTRDCSNPLLVEDFLCTPLNDPNPHDPWLGTIVRRNNPNVYDTDTRSAYAFDTMTLSEQWLLNAGLRFDSYSTKADLIATSTVPAAKVGNDDDLWNYQVGLVYKPSQDGSVYASYGTSSSPSGAANGEGAAGDNVNITTSIADLDPIKSRNLELGTKWDVLGGHLSLTAAIFRSEVTNARVPSENGTTQLAGDKRVDGIEIGITGEITEQWRVFGGYTHLDSELTDAGFVNVGTATNPVWVPSPDKGNRFPNTPDDSASLWTTYQLLPKLTIGAGAFYTSKVYGNTANTKWVPAYTRFDAMAAYKVNDHFSLQLNVQNLTDKLYFDKAYQTHYVSVAPGRSAVLTANFTF